MDIRDEEIRKIEGMAKVMRYKALKMAFSAGANGAHLGAGMSSMEILASLYGGIMKFDAKNPRCKNRDRLIISKAHCVLSYYTALVQAGFIDDQDLDLFETNEGYLPGHPVMNEDKGIEFSGGSLGLGLSLGVGMALAAKKTEKDHRIFVILGDGECDEGSVWEAAMSAAHFKLDNLVAIIDRNRLQYDGETHDIMDLGDFNSKWQSFGWETTEIDGHNVAEIYDSLNGGRKTIGKPYVVIANTVKGKGVSFMENRREWHHARLTKDQYDAAIKELNNLG